MNANTVTKAELKAAVIRHFLKNDKSICEGQVVYVHAGYFVSSETGRVVVRRTDGSVEQPDESSEGENFISYIGAGYILTGGDWDEGSWKYLVSGFGASQAGVDQFRRKIYDDYEADFDEEFLALLAREPAVRQHLAERAANGIDFDEDIKVVRKALKRLGIGSYGYTLTQS